MAAGDGRYYGKEAAQIIIKLAAGNGFSKARAFQGTQSPSLPARFAVVVPAAHSRAFSGQRSWKCFVAACACFVL
jgi:phosphoglucomutase